MKKVVQFKFNFCLNYCYEIIPFDNGSSIDIKDGRLEINKDLYFIKKGGSISLHNGSRGKLEVTRLKFQRKGLE